MSYRGGYGSYGPARGQSGSPRGPPGPQRWGRSRGSRGGSGSSLSWQHSEARAKMLDSALGYGDDYGNEGFTGKRPHMPTSEPEPVAVKKPKNSTVGMMSHMLQESKKDLKGLKTQSLSQDNFSQVLERQQKLLEMQAKIIAEMSERGSETVDTKPLAKDRDTKKKSVPSVDNKFSGSGATNTLPWMSRKQAETRPGKPEMANFEDPYSRSGAESLNYPEEPYYSGYDATYESGGLDLYDRTRPTRGRGATRGRGITQRIERMSGVSEDPYYSGDLDRPETSYPEPYARVGVRHMRPDVRGRPASPIGREDIYCRGEEEDPYFSRPATRPRRNINEVGFTPSGRRGDEDPYASRRMENPYDYGARDPYRPWPYAGEDPYGEDPYGEDPYGEDPYGEDPYGDHRMRRRVGPPDYDEPLTISARGLSRTFPGDISGRRDAYDDLYYPEEAEFGDSFKPRRSQTGEFFVSVEGKLNIFIRLLLRFDNLLSPVSALESTRHNHTDIVKIRTDYSNFEDMDHDPPSYGIFRINGIILSVEQDYRPNLAKEKTYQKALYRLLTKSVSEIFSISSKLYMDLPTKAKEDSKNKRGFRFVLSRLKTLVDILRQEVMETHRQGLEQKLVHEIDVACGNADAGITLVYIRKPGDPMVTCEFYADDLMLGSAEAYKNKTAMMFAYKNVKRLLMNWSIAPDEIVRENKRLHDLDIMQLHVLDVQFKGKNHERGSNLVYLKMMYPETFASDIAEKREIVAFDHSYDRNTVPYRVLEDIASSNHMLLEYVIFSDLDQGPFRAVIFLQGELIGDSHACSRAPAKYSAAAQAINYLRDNNTLIRTVGRNYKKPNFNFVETQEKAKKLKLENPELGQHWDRSHYPKPGEEDLPYDEFTPYVDQVLENMLVEYSCTPGLEELILDRDFPTYHLTMMQRLSAKYEFHMETKQGDSGQDRTGRTIIQKSLIKTAFPKELVKIIRSTGGMTGRYQLVQWTDDSGRMVMVK